MWVLALALVAVTAQLPPKSEVVSVMTKVMDYALTNNIDEHGNNAGEKVANCGWTHGAMMQGVMATHRITSDQKYLDYAMWWGEAQKWQTCNYPKVAR
jgi:rhamnogalacturonyl hydrolase YesR